MTRYAIAALYCAVVLVANLTAGRFIPMPVFGLLSVGTLFFGATFTLRDYAHQHGRPFVYKMIAAAAVTSVVGAAITGTPLRIIAASFFTILLAESADTEVYQRLLGRPWMQRVMGSNAVSIPVDSVVFSVLAFAGAMPFIDVIGVIWGDIVAKFVIGLLVGAVKVVRDARNYPEPA